MENQYGQSAVPAGLSDVASIAAGSFHSLALKADGTSSPSVRLSNPMHVGNTFHCSANTHSGRVYVLQTRLSGDHKLKPPFHWFPARVRNGCSSTRRRALQSGFIACAGDNSSEPKISLVRFTPPQLSLHDATRLRLDIDSPQD